MVDVLKWFNGVMIKTRPEKNMRWLDYKPALLIFNSIQFNIMSICAKAIRTGIVNYLCIVVVAFKVTFIKGTHVMHCCSECNFSPHRLVNQHSDRYFEEEKSYGTWQMVYTMKCEQLQQKTWILLLDLNKSSKIVSKKCD